MKRSPLPIMAAVDELFESNGCIHAGLFLEKGGKGVMFHIMPDGLRWQNFEEVIKNRKEDFYVFRPRQPVDAGKLMTSARQVEKDLKGYDHLYDRDGKKGFYYCGEIISEVFLRAGYDDPFDRAISLQHPMTHFVSKQFGIGPIISCKEIFINPAFARVHYHQGNEIERLQNQNDISAYRHLARKLQSLALQGQFPHDITNMEKLVDFSRTYADRFSHYENVERSVYNDVPGGRAKLQDPKIVAGLSQKAFAKLDRVIFGAVASYESNLATDKISK